MSHDVAAGYAYFATTANPAKVIKVALSTGTNSPVYLGSSSLNVGETTLGVVMDTRDEDPAKHYLYFCTTGSGSIRRWRAATGCKSSVIPRRVIFASVSTGQYGLNLDSSGSAQLRRL